MRERKPEMDLRSGPARAEGTKTGSEPLTCGKRLRRALRQPKVLCALPPVQHKRRALSGGKAPQCLQRKLLPPAERVRKVNKLCAWIENPPHLPRLREGPLAGRCLEAVVAPRESRSGRDLTTSPSPSGLPGYPEGVRARAHPRTDTGRSHASLHRLWTSISLETGMEVPSLASRPMPGPYAFAPSINIEHLQRFDLSSPSRFSPRTLPFSQRKSPPFKYGLGRSHSSDARVSSWIPSAVSQYLHRITSRFSQRVKRLGKFGPVKMILVEMPSGFSLSTTWARTALASPLAGPAAGRTLLLNLIGNIPFPESSSGEKAISRAKEQDANASVPSRIMQPERLAPQARSAPEAAQQGFYPQTGSLPLPEAGLDGGQPLVAPPLAAEVPATLHLPRVPFDAPTPFASATLRHEALRDEADLVQEDLDYLADKIKRILDEDARRHGIQV